jgi:hypothetical protein
MPGSRSQPSQATKRERKKDNKKKKERSVEWGEEERVEDNCKIEDCEKEKRSRSFS